MKTQHTVYLLSLLIVSALQNSTAQIALSGTNYSESFDGLGLGLPPGWSVRTNATATSVGSPAPFTTNSTSWASTSGQFANFASTVNHGTNFLGTESSAIQAACTNRSPAVRQTGSFGDPGAAFVLQLQNTLGFAQFQLTVDLNMLSVQSRSNLWIIDYGIGSNPASFVTVWTNSDPGLFGAVTKAVTLSPALDNQSQPVWIRIVALEASAGTGSRDTFGIDNFRLNYQPNAPVSPIPLNIQMIGTNAVLTWTNPAFGLQSSTSVSGAYSNVSGAASPYTNPPTGSQRYFRLKAN